MGSNWHGNQESHQIPQIEQENTITLCCLTGEKWSIGHVVTKFDFKNKMDHGVDFL